MINPKKQSEQLLFSTVRIAVSYRNGDAGVGTGVFFRYPLDDGTEIPVIVTNKHVIRDADKGTFSVHLMDHNAEQKSPNGENVDVRVDNFDTFWRFHPDDSVDLCAMPAAAMIDLITSKGQQPFYCTFSEGHLPSEDDLSGLSAMEDVVMAGYPIGLHDNTHKFPLLRRGITASHPAIDFNDEYVGMVDIACFAGSSGSLRHLRAPIQSSGSLGANHSIQHWRVKSSLHPTPRSMRDFEKCSGRLFPFHPVHSRSSPVLKVSLDILDFQILLCLRGADWSPRMNESIRA